MKIFSAPVVFNLLLVSLFVCLVYFLMYFKLDITIQTQGIVKPESDSTIIDSMVTGQVKEVNYKEGDLVDKGDVIVILNPGVGYESYKVTATIDGKIQHLYAKNPGSVIKIGNPVVVLVPKGDECIVEAKLMLKDRGYVRVGQDVKVRLANKDSIKFGPINGKITSISPDAVQSNEGSYFVLKIKLDKQKFKYKDTFYDLHPGIDVITFILTGNRTFVDYIISPLASNLKTGLQEN